MQTLPTPRDNAFNEAKTIARDNGQMGVYEQLVVQYTNPQGEWGHNNIRDLVTLFHMSGQTNEQIYNILYNMGVEKEKAYAAIQEYLPQKNTNEMSVKEQLDFTGQTRSLVDAMDNFKSADNANYNADAVIRTCEAYMNTNKDGFAPSQLAGMAKRMISDLNQFDFIPAVKECINGIEQILIENIMGIEVDSAYSDIANGSQSGMHNGVIDRLKVLKQMNEEDIRKNIIGDDTKEFSTWVPRIHMMLERAEVILGKDEPKEPTLSEKFNLKGKLKAIIEKANVLKTDNSELAVQNIKSICENYLKELYDSSKVSEAQTAAGVLTALAQFEWLDTIKESTKEIYDFLQENYMSFEVGAMITNLQHNNNSSFYSGAIQKLSEIKSLSESEIREQVKYGLESFTWVPQIKYLVETCNSLDGNISNDNNGIITRKYSPVVEHEDSTYFYLSGGVYGIKEHEITAVDPKTMGALFLTLIAVTENFKFNPGSLTYYKAGNAIEYNLSESGVTFKYNHNVIDIKESNDIRNFLLSNGSFRMNETSELDMVVKAYENAASFVELDFVDSISSRTKQGLTTNVIRLGESIYINNINTGMQMNEMIKADSAIQAIELVKEYVNFDISASVFDLLEGEQKEIAIVEAKRNSLFDKIQFLKESRSRIGSLDLKNPEVAEADQLLVEEISKWQGELNNLTEV